MIRNVLNKLINKIFGEENLSVINEKSISNEPRYSYSDEGYLRIFKAFDIESLKCHVDEMYNILEEATNRNAGFNKQGCKEFVAASILLAYDRAVANDIYNGMLNVFHGYWGPLDFSDFMDKVVEKSIISWKAWNSAFRFLDENHKWLENHKIATAQRSVSSCNDIFIIKR